MNIPHLARTRRLWTALQPQPAPRRQVEPLLRLDTPYALPPRQPDPSPRVARRAVEQLLEEGSQRFYRAMRETEVIDGRSR